MAHLHPSLRLAAYEDKMNVYSERCMHVYMYLRLCDSDRAKLVCFWKEVIHFCYIVTLTVVLVFYFARTTQLTLLGLTNILLKTRLQTSIG